MDKKFSILKNTSFLNLYRLNQKRFTTIFSNFNLRSSSLKQTRIQSNLKQNIKSYSVKKSTSTKLSKHLVNT